MDNLTLEQRAEAVAKSVRYPSSWLSVESRQTRALLDLACVVTELARENAELKLRIEQVDTLTQLQQDTQTRINNIEVDILEKIQKLLLETFMMAARKNA
jgi:hypothetical protein